MTKSRKRVNFAIILIFCVLTVIIFFKTREFSKNKKVVITFLINGIIWIRLMYKEIKIRAYSMTLMHWLFCIFFFCFAPVVQYTYGKFPWIWDRSDDILRRANILLLIWTLAILVGKKIANINYKREKIIIKKIATFNKILPILTVINIWNVIIRIKNVGIENMFARSTNTGISFTSYGSLSMMISGSLQAISYFAAALSILQFKKRNYQIVYLVINCMCILVAYFPSSIARYATAVIYMGLFLMFYRKSKKSSYFILFFILSFSIAMPVLNVFRTQNFLEVNILKTLNSTILNLVDTWKAVDYDAYTIFTLSIENVDMHGAGGMHILSIILFWVPRAIWPTKALSGSYEMAHDRGLGFDNLSCPLPAEGMLDGGICGLILFGVVIGYIMEKVDLSYWSRTDKEGDVVDTFDLIYPVIVIFWFFMCRGDMFYTFAYLFAYIAVWWMINPWITSSKRRIICEQK